MSWGEKNGTKDRLAKRNKEIVSRYYSGVTIAELGIMYFLSEKRIQGIIHEYESSIREENGVVLCQEKVQVKRGLFLDIVPVPKKPCAYPGCPNLTDGRYCPEHQTKVNAGYEKYMRDPGTKRRYGRAWKRIRDKYAAEHPFCEMCFERGIIVPTEEIHHKLSLSEGGTHDRSNLIALCKSCHSTIHAKRGD